MHRLILLFAFITTVLLTSAVADPTAPVVEPAASQEAVAAEARPVTGDAVPAIDTPPGAESAATSPDTAAPAVPAETK